MPSGRRSGSRKAGRPDEVTARFSSPSTIKRARKAAKNQRGGTGGRAPRARKRSKRSVKAPTVSINFGRIFSAIAGGFVALIFGLGAGLRALALALGRIIAGAFSKSSARAASKAARRRASSAAKGRTKSARSPAARSTSSRAANARSGARSTTTSSGALTPGLVRAPFRIRLIACAAALFGAIVVGRAVELQLMDGTRYVEAAQRQSKGRLQIQAKRGVIKDRHGAELAITVDVDSVFAEPRNIPPKLVASHAAKLAKVLELPRRELAEKLGSKRSFTYLRRRVDGRAAQRVRKLNLVGVGIHAEPKRFYSNVGLAAHVLGFTGWDGEGKAGVERRFEGELRGKTYELPSVRDARGRRIYSEGFVPQAVLEGADLELTIDRQIQHAAEEALEEAVTDNGGKSGVAIVVEPSTGEVLALASYPTFNPNNLSGSKATNRKNRAISMIYEPGSTMKMVTIAAALEEGVINADDRVDCEGGKWRIGGRTIGDADHKYGLLTIPEVMKVSSNICAAKIGMQLGRKQLHRWLGRFGFGARTGLELPGELRGMVRPADKWRDITLANIAFGQGIAVTPVQVAQALAALANDGVMMPLTLVRSVADKTGRVQELPKRAAKRVLTKRTARAVTEMMATVTKKGGTAPKAAIPGFSVAGKTGTAQKIDPVTKAYSHELHIASFAGFAPADSRKGPKVAILVMVDEPKKSMYGGQVAAPAFRKIALNALSALEVFPEDTEAKERFLAGYKAARSADLPKAKLSKIKEISTEPAELGAIAGLAAPKKSAPGLERALSDTARKLLGFEEVPGRRGASVQTMPNLLGLNLREVLNRTASVRCDPVVHGSGAVVVQKPSAGVKIRPGQQCTFELSAVGG